MGGFRQLSPQMERSGNFNAAGNAKATERMVAICKVSSRCSTDKLVRAPFLIHCALNNDERATHSRFPLTNAMWRVRGRLTLMLAAAANATATPAPARHLWLVRTSPSACLSLPRARGERRWFSNVFRAFQPSSYVTVLGAGSGGEKMVKRMSATLIKLASSHRLSPVDGWGKRWPNRHGSRRFAPRGGERSLSLAVAFWFQRPRGFATAGTRH